MAFSMYTASVPVFQHMLRNLSHILDKGEASAQAHRALDLATLRWIPAPRIPGLRSGGTFPVVHSVGIMIFEAAT